MSCLMRASQSGNLEIVQILLDNYADVNFIYPNNNALSYAMKNGHFLIAKRLIEYDAVLDEVGLIYALNKFG